MDVIESTSRLQIAADLKEMTSNVFHQQVMLCEHHLIIVMSTLLETEIGKYLEGLTPVLHATENPLGRLVSDTFYAVNQNGKPLNSMQYWPEVPCLSCKHVCIFGKQVSPSTHKKKGKLPHMLSSLIARWFDLTDTVKSEARAEFINIILRMHGPGVLFLQQVWAIYKDMPS